MPRIEDGVNSLNFREKGIKPAARNYERNIFKNVVESLNKTMLQISPWIFRQESGSAHKTKATQQWLEDHVSEFNSSDHWPSASPDLNALEYKLWSVLEGIVSTRRSHNLDVVVLSILILHYNMLY